MEVKAGSTPMIGIDGTVNGERDGAVGMLLADSKRAYECMGVLAVGARGWSLSGCLWRCSAIMPSVRGYWSVLIVMQ